MAASQLRQPVECVVTVDGVEIGPLYPYLREVQVAMSRRAASTAQLQFDSVRLENGQWSVQDTGILTAWKRIRIDARFGGRAIEVMRGFISEVACNYPEDRSATNVVVTAQDESMVLDREHVKATLSSEAAPKSDGTLAKEIAGAHNLKFAGDVGLTAARLNIDGSYMEFLRRRAAANGFELHVRRGTLHFHAPRLEQQPVTPILVYAGNATNCLSFAVRYDGHKPDAVVLKRSADAGQEVEVARFTSELPLLGKVAASSVSQGLKPFEWVVRATGGMSPAEAARLAQAKANDTAWKITAQGELDGALYGDVLFTHELVCIDGAGSTHSGTYYVDEVKHKFSLDGYRLGFKLLRNATGDDTVQAEVDPLAAVLGA
jgi:hypothetical protein